MTRPYTVSRNVFDRQTKVVGHWLRVLMPTPLTPLAGSGLPKSVLGQIVGGRLQHDRDHSFQNELITRREIN
jgi:hypothetical protein